MQTLHPQIFLSFFLQAGSKHVAFISHRLQRERRPSPIPSLERYRSVKRNHKLCNLKANIWLWYIWGICYIDYVITVYFQTKQPQSYHCHICCAVFIVVYCFSQIKFEFISLSLQLQIHYDKQLGNLIVHVLQARNLTPRDNNGYSDPFVKVYLLPGRGWVKGVEAASTP